MSDPSISYPHQQHNHHHYQHHNHHHHHHHHHQQQSAVLNASSPTTSMAGVDSAQVVYRQSRTERRSNSFAMATCYSAYELSPPQPPPPPAPQRTVQVPVQKDYSRPLHVDCSVEYELPNTAKPPQGVRNEPLLMIHPCYFRKIESQRRSPFVNNLPVRQQQQQQQQQHHQHHHHQQHQQLQQQQQQQHQPVATAVTTAVKRRRPQQPQAAQYPAPYAAAAPNWEQMPPLVPISQAYKRDPMSSITSTSISTSACAAYSSSSGSDSGHWTDPDHSPDRPDDINNKQQQSHHQQQQQHHHHHHHQQHILTGKYRQYLRAHRLHPYVTSAIPLASTFPQIQQVCYNV